MRTLKPNVTSDFLYFAQRDGLTYTFVAVGGWDPTYTFEAKVDEVELSQ